MYCLPCFFCFFFSQHCSVYRWVCTMRHCIFISPGSSVGFAQSLYSFLKTVLFKWKVKLSLCGAKSTIMSPVFTGACCCALHARFETHPEVVTAPIQRFRYAYIFNGIKEIFLTSDLTGLTGKNMSWLQTFLALQTPPFPALCFLGELNSQI